MIHLGDIKLMDGSKIPAVDVITGGSPCQDFSIAHAGEREGLNGERSGLFYEMIRVIKEMRANDKANGRADDDLRPRWVIFENVPGILSAGTPKGEDFRIVLEEFVRIVFPEAVIPRPKKWSNAGCIMGPGFSLAWRVTDNQYWGTPQRRRRIGVVLDLNGNSASEVLFEQQGLCRDPQKSGKEEEATARRTAESLGDTSKNITEGGRRQTDILIEMTSTKNTIVKDGISPTLTQRMGTGGNQVNAVLQHL